MIRRSVIKARAAHGYAWLQEVGPYFNLDVNRLHLRPELLDVVDVDWCPLSHSDNEPVPAGQWHFNTVCDRLVAGRLVPGTGKKFSIMEEDLDSFLTDHGFDIYEPKYRWQLWGQVGTWGFLPGQNRDWALLTQAWREIIAANSSALAKAPLRATMTVREIP